MSEPLYTVALSGSGSEIGRTHIACRRVDEIPGKESCADEAAHFLAIHAVRQYKARPVARAPCIAREAIGSERKAQDGLFRIAVNIAGETIIAEWQSGGESAGRKRVAAITKPEKDTRKPARSIRQQQHLARLALEARRRDPGGTGTGMGVAPIARVVRTHEPDRRCRRVLAGDESFEQGVIRPASRKEMISLARNLIEWPESPQRQALGGCMIARGTDERE